MVDEELALLRTKCVLLDIEAAHITPDRWAAVYYGSKTFRFEDPYRIFYNTEKETLQTAISIALSGGRGTPRKFIMER